LGGIYIDGVSVPTSNNSPASSTLTQAGNLALGAQPVTSPNNFFDGYMSEVRLWSVARTQASIQANMGINLTGSETNLVGLWQGAGSFNDLTSNANNLTATNGAIATQAANPYHSTEYGIITNVTSSQVTVFTGTDYVIPNQTLSSPAYSTSKLPYGFPGGREKWRVKALYRNIFTQSSPSLGTWYNLGSMQLAMPTGEWVAWYEGSLYVANSTNAPSGFATLSTANNSESDTEMTVRPLYSGSLNAMMGNAYRTRGYNNTSQTTYYLNIKTDLSGASAMQWGPTSENTIIECESAYA
ncbi:MAG TPA: LamG-like jellyroll fold domain-containing protein, partial [Ktedonobacteraceae bacterium]|nr:LamG-like jellyroll fold domain-containing protein [Ktedonobacteraceae bacterium]